MPNKETNCPDCGVAIGQPHLPGCDIESCPKCGLQLLSCDCTNSEVSAFERLPWTGLWQGIAEAVENDWYVCMVQGAGWVRCNSTVSGAMPDRTRVLFEHDWDPSKRAFIHREHEDQARKQGVDIASESVIAYGAVIRHGLCLIQEAKARELKANFEAVDSSEMIEVFYVPNGALCVKIDFTGLFFREWDVSTGPATGQVLVRLKGMKTLWNAAIIPHNKLGQVAKALLKRDADIATTIKHRLPLATHEGYSSMAKGVCMNENTSILNLDLEQYAPITQELTKLL